MAQRLPTELVERVLAHHPVPVADAVAALVAAEGPFEERDRVVEAFRAVLRTLAAVVLCARVQFGSGPGAESAQVAELVRGLRSRGLTDGQWQALVREMLRPWSGAAAAAFPLPELVELVHGKKAELPKLVDELLVMRKSETVAHGASGTKAALGEILDRRVPQLARLLELTDALWVRARLAVPLARPEDDGEAQGAWLLMGDTPSRGRWRRVELGSGVRATPGEAVLVDPDGKPLVALHPLVLVRRPSPEATEEVFVLDGGGKRGAVFVAFPSMSEHREADAFKTLERALADHEDPAEGSDAPAGDRPYRGLSSFGPEHAALFFGREEQAEALANRIRRHPLVTVTGPSGSGKTSLLRAGVMPQLGDAKLAAMRPGSEPVENLASAVCHALGGWIAEDALLERVRRDPTGLGPLLTGWGRETGGRLVLLVDQTEEVFTLCHDEPARHAFALALAAIEGEAEGPTRVVVSVREDFFGRLATLPALRGLYNRQVEVVTTPDRDALARTLVAPAKHFGYAFEDEPLVWTMVDSVKDEPAALALLSFCADRLWDLRDRAWKRLTRDAYEAVGGVEGALATHADALLAELGPQERRAARSLMLRLVTGERTRAVARKAELLEASAAPDLTAAVLDRLVAARLVTASDDDHDHAPPASGAAAVASGGARVELVHEALIRHWGALATWLGEDEEGQRVAHALRLAARDWSARERPRDLLWRGDVLAEMRRWRARSTEALTGIEAAFAEASDAEERRGRRIRRSLIAGALAATSAFGVAMFFQRQQAVHAEEQASDARVRAEIRGLVAEARTHEPEHRTGRALALLRAAAFLEAGAGERGETPVSVDLARLERAGAGSRVLAGHTAPLFRLALSPDASKVVTAALDETARIWDLETGTALATLPGHGNVVRAVAWSPDGKIVATASSNASDTDGVVRTWEASSGKLLRELRGHEKPVTELAFVGGSSVLVSGANDGTVRLWKLDGDAPPAILQRGEEWITELAASRDGSLLAIAASKKVVVWDVVKGAVRHELPPDKDSIMRIAFSPDASFLVTDGTKGIRIWDVVAGKERAALAIHEKRVTEVAVSPDGKLVASGSRDGTVKLSSAAGEGAPRVLANHQGEVTSILFSRDGRILTTCDERAVRVWDVATGAQLAELGGHEAEIVGAVMTPDGRRLVTASGDKTARVWPLDRLPIDRILSAEGQQIVHVGFAAPDRVVTASLKGIFTWPALGAAGLVRLPGQDGDLRGLVTSAAGDLLATSAQDGLVRVWSLNAPAPPRDFKGDGKPLRGLALSPDASRIAAAASDGAVLMWDAKSGAELPSLTGHTGPVVAVAFSPDGQRLASASWDKTARIWDLSTGRTAHVLSGYEGWATGVTYSRDGKRLATLSTHEARIYDAATGAELVKLTGHDQHVLAGAFSPDDTLFATAAADDTVRTWKVADGTALRLMRGHTAAVLELAWSSDGQRIATVAGDDTARVWHAPTGRLLDTFRAHDKIASSVALSPSGDRILTAGAGGVVVIARTPPLDRARTLADTGAATNLRVCRTTFEVVAVQPFPPADTVWAPDAACAVGR